QIENAYINKVVNNLTAYFAEKFGDNCTVNRGWDNASLNYPSVPPPDEPPIVYYVNYTIEVYFGHGIDDELIVGVLNGGAIYISVFRPLPSPYSSTLNLTLPHGVIVKNFPYTNGTWNQRHYYIWDGSKEVKLEISGEFAKKYNRSNITMDVVIDMHTLQNVKGKEYLYTSVNVSANVYVLALPDALESKFPENLKMDYLNADVIRLILSKNVVNLSFVYETINATIEYGKNRLMEMFGGKIDFRAEAIQNISWNGNPLQIDELPPISIRISGNSTLDFGEYIKNHRLSLSLTYTYNLNLPAIEDFNINYTVIFPKNIEVLRVECNAPHDKYYVQGRDAVSVHITNTTENLKIFIRISFDIDFERVYPFIVILAVFIGIWIAVSIMAYRKKREGS
ncbi:MAG: hypothetical protein ACPL1Y_00615, partial [Thermoplasmata archaeon]